MTRPRTRLCVQPLEDRLAPATLLHSLFPVASGPQTGAAFGQAVAADTNFLVVGAAYADVGPSLGYGVGQAFVYNASTGALVSTLNNPNAAFQDYFGAAVAVSGNTVVVGAYGYAGSFGAAYVFNATTGALIATLNNPTPTPSGGDNFGESVAVSGNVAVVGAGDEGNHGVGAAYVFNATTGALIATLNNPTPGGDDDFGFAVAISGNTAAVGAWQDDTGALNSGSAYVFNATTGALVATLNNPTPAGSEGFGFSVAVSGNAVAVGAPQDDTGATDSGSAYVFNATTGALVATLNNPTPASSAFGYSVGLSGNLAAVGARNDAMGGSGYVFNATTGALIATLNNPAPAPYDRFAFSIALSGNTALVGDPNRDAGASGSGSAYVFNATSGAQLATPNNPTIPVGDNFGDSVAVSGNTIAVGSPSDDTTGVIDSGSAYVFNAATGALVATLNNPAPADFDYFGVSVAVSGNTVVVGADGYPGGGAYLGIAYVFNATTGALVATLTDPNQAPGHDLFGFSVAISGNIAVVGAKQPAAIGIPAGVGTAYVFNATTGALIATLNNPTPADSDYFGGSVAVSGNTVVVGAEQDDTGALDSGSAYVFNATTGSLIATLNNPTPAAQDYFGYSVAISGNVVTVGAYGDDTGSPDSGAAYVFNATTGALISTLNNPTPTGDQFGNSVAVSGNTVIVGALYDDTGAQPSGSAYEFNATTGALIDTLNNPTPAYGDKFGESVAVSGTTVVVGAGQDDTQNADQGAAYVYSIAAPRVQSTQVNDGSAQRSRVTSLTIRFDSQVTFLGPVSDAFNLMRTGGGTVNFAASASVINGVTVVTLSDFTGAESQFGSLNDGRYTLTALASQISGNGQLLDGNGDGTPGDNYVFGDAQGLFRLFGDVNGDQTVNGLDFGYFKNAFATQIGDANYLSYLDFNGDGVINGLDFGQFRTRFGTILP